MKFPINEKDLSLNYNEIMPEIDRLSLERRGKVWANWPSFVKNAGTWECLRNIHVVLFDGLFTFAGKIRTQNISKGFRFANAIFLPSILPIIEKMPQKNFHEILEKYIEMNIAHPFREGNGRAARLWLDAILQKEINSRINWEKISRSEYLSAMERSPINSLELFTLLQKNLLDKSKLNDKNLFMAGLSASYSYEMP